MKKPLFALATLGLILAATRAISNYVSGSAPREGTAGEQTLREQWSIMGTIWSAEIVPHGRMEDAKAALARAQDELRHVDQVMSEWRPDSPISQVNRAAGKEMVAVPRDLLEILQRSIAYSAASGGVFDVTWRGMGRIWRFDESFMVPSKEAVEKARSMVNYRDIRIEGDRAGLKREGMAIGLGGIAKGYGIDRAAGVISQAGFTDFLFDGGGDILVSGTRNGRPWRLGIQNPRADRGTLLGWVQLTRGVLVTSGDYERFRIADGTRYHHIIDPSTGYPANNCQSVTVIAQSAERATVLGKVVFILGPEQGLALAVRERLEALIIDKKGRRVSTPGFDRMFVAAD